MAWVTPEQSQDAKRVNTYDFLQARYPDTIKRTAHDEYRLVEHPSLIITPSNGKWDWKTQGFGGVDPVNFLVKVWSVSYPDAVLEVLGERHNIPDRPRPPEQKRKPFSLPPQNKSHEKAIGYLQGRGIDREIIEVCIAAGIVYESSGKYHNCVFVGQDPTGKARFACSRGIGTDFKRDATGSEKRYNFCLGSTMPGEAIAVFESPIDALSMATINRHNSAVGARWKDHSYLSLGGTSPLALLQYLKDHPETSHVYLFLDNDKAGLDGMERIKSAIRQDAVLGKQVVEVGCFPPKHGKDYNEHLLHLRQKIAGKKARTPVPVR